LLDGLVEQERDVGHMVSLGTTSDPVVGRYKQGESAESANINGMKRRWSSRVAGSARRAPRHPAGTPAHSAFGLGVP
jgi:hypothetical protein